jgi:hypothetical protein
MRVDARLGSLPVLALLPALLAGCNANSLPPFKEQATPLTVAGNAAAQGPVDGIPCEAGEGFVLHVHPHLAVYTFGHPRSIPSDIGITEAGSSSCLCWLHTHDESGIIHVESPVVRKFTLGNFFHIWGQPLGPEQVGPELGEVTAFLDGAPVTVDVTEIELKDHAVIQLDVGTPVVPAQPYTFPPGF